MTEDEESQWLWIVVQIIYIHEANYRQYQRKSIPDDMWEHGLNSVLGFLQSEVVKKWWDNRIGNVSESFREVVNQQLDLGNTGNWQPRSPHVDSISPLTDRP